MQNLFNLGQQALTMDRIVLVIQARTGSTRLPGKILKPILGETVLFRMVERLKGIRNKVSLVIATSTSPEDTILEKEALHIDIPCFRGNLYNLLDRHYQAAKAFDAEIVLKIPSDCPLIDPAIVDAVIDFYLENKGQYDFISNLHPATWPDGNDVELMTFACLEKTWHEATRPMELEHTTPYIWENSHLFKIANLTMQGGLNLSKKYRFTLDYEEDLSFIQKIFEALYPTNPFFSLKEILDFVDRHPEIYKINAKYLGEYWYRNFLNELKTIN